MNTLAAVVGLALALGVGWAVPAAFARRFVPWAAGSSLVRPNYRGRPVAPSLGIAWAVWAVGLLGVQALFDLLQRTVPRASQVGAFVERLGASPLGLPFFGVPFVLVVGCVLLGLADDAFGHAGPKGFRGHLRALAAGRVTTGVLKLAGIGGLAVFYGVGAASRLVERGGGEPGAATLVLACVLATLVIALSANLMNLLDVRPGRALKAYVVLAPAPAAAFAVSAVGSYNRGVAGLTSQVGPLGLDALQTAAVALAFVAAVLGPALAVWRYDLSETAMLGDAGSNALGGVLGYLLAAVLPLGGLAVAAGVLLGLNLASERVSFSSFIERVPALDRLDRLGRRPLDAGPEGETESDGPAHGAVRYHAHEGRVDRED